MATADDFIGQPGSTEHGLEQNWEQTQPLITSDGFITGTCRPGLLRRSPSSTSFSKENIQIELQ